MASREARIDDESSRRAADRELARRALRGDAEAQRELVRRMTPLVWSLCRRSGLPPTEAEDVSQEVFISALDALPRFRGECRLSTWFSTLTLRRASDDDLQIVRGALIESPPSALERRLRIALAARTAEPAGALWLPRVDSLAQAAAIGALAALGAAQTLPPTLATMGQALLCLTGASVGFAGRAIYDAVERRCGW